MTLVKIFKGNYGMTYRFIIKNVDYSDKTPLLYVWNEKGTIINGHTCSVSLVGNDTVVEYQVPQGAFDTVGVYWAEIKFKKEGFEEDTETFTWEVLP